MSREGMVHALKQIHRVLQPRGVLGDLRPDRYPDPGQPHPNLPSVLWASGGREIPAGVLEKAPENLRRHRTATAGAGSATSAFALGYTVAPTASTVGPTRCATSRN